MTNPVGNHTGRNGQTIYPMPRAVAARKIIVGTLSGQMATELFQRAVPLLVDRLTPHLHPEPLQRPLADHEPAAADAIPAREITVLALAADGLTNKRIGARLNCTEDVVKIDIRRLLRRLGARDRTHAVAIAVRRGLIP